MILHGLVPSRTHNLLVLAAELNAAGIPTPVTPNELAVLNPYAVTLRYDDEELPLVSPENGRALVATVLAWAKEAIG